MKKLSLVFMLAILLPGFAAQAQKVRISVLGQEGLVFGEMSKNEINNPSAGYVNYASAAGLEVNYYLQNRIGFGLRWTGSYYARDLESYESDLTGLLGINNQMYDITQLYAFWDIGTDIGVSYLLDISEKLQLEPYFYMGFKLLSSPVTSLTYFQNNTTFHYKSKTQFFVGMGYAPGVKLHWNPLEHLGFYISLEHEGSAFFKEEQRSLLYSYDSFSISDTEKKYAIHSLYFGLGISFRF